MTRVILVLFSAMTAAAIASAQTIEIVVLDRTASYVQTTAGSSSLDGVNPYTVGVFINGSGLGALTSFSFKKPDDAVTVYSGEPDGDEWRAPTSGNAFSSMADLNAAFGGGNYTISVSGFSDSTLTMTNLVGGTNDGLPNMPFVIATQDGNAVTWSDGKMLVDPTKQLTITTTEFATNFIDTQGRVGLGVFGDVSFEATNESPPDSFLFSGNTAQLIIAADSLTPGYIYSGDMEFNSILGITDLSGIYGGSAQGVVIYTAFASFQIQVIPEPSTYAAIFGALALMGAMIYRRRQLA